MRTGLWTTGRRKRFSYASSLSPMAPEDHGIKEKIREKYGPEWARLPPAQQGEIIDRCLVGPSAPAPAAPRARALPRLARAHGPEGGALRGRGRCGRAGVPSTPPRLRRAPGRADTCRLAAVPSRRAGRGWREGRKHPGGWKGGLEPEVGGWGVLPGESVENRRAEEGVGATPSRPSPAGRRGLETSPRAGGSCW